MKASVVRAIALIAFVASACARPAATATDIKTTDAENEAAFFLYRCTNDRLFRSRHEKRCRIARVEK